MLWSLPIICFLVIAAYIGETLRDEVDRSSVMIDKLTISPIISKYNFFTGRCTKQC